MVRKSPLDDPSAAQFAWARFRRLMRAMGLVTLVTIVIALLWLYDADSEASLHYYVAVALGVGATMMLTGALMGLMFLSSGTGHDESVDNSLPDQ